MLWEHELQAYAAILVVGPGFATEIANFSVLLTSPTTLQTLIAEGSLPEHNLCAYKVSVVTTLRTSQFN